jgi:hypothetical protein
MAELPKKNSKSAVALAFALGTGAGAGGHQLSVNSPVHLTTMGETPIADEWVCEPEGGIFDAPVICRYKTVSAPDAGN